MFLHIDIMCFLYLLKYFKTIKKENLNYVYARTNIRKD